MPQNDSRYPLLNHKYLHYGTRTITTNFTAVVDGPECVILVNATPVTVTLPDAASHKGYAVYVKKISAPAGNVTIARTGADLIDGATSQTLSVQYDGLLFVSDGTNWWILPTATSEIEGRLVGRQIFDTPGSGTYVPTPGTRRAIVRGCGGGGGGGGVGATDGTSAAGAAGGNSGIIVEREFVAASGFLIGGPFTVGAIGVGGTAGNGAQGGISVITIEGITLTAVGGSGANGSASGNPNPVIIGPSAQAAFGGSNADYQASDLGQPGWTLAVPASSIQAIGGAGGSGSFGIGGRGAGGVSALGAGQNATGNGAGGGGAAISINTAAADGGDGSPGIWIVEEYT